MSLITRLMQDRKDQVFTDAKIVHGAKIFHVHSLVLMSISPVFERMLRGTFVEANSKELDFTAEPLDAVELMIDFLYDHRYDVYCAARLPTHLRVYILAEKYDIKTLMCASSEILAEQIGDGNDNHRRGHVAVRNGVKVKPWRDDEIIEAVRMLWYEPAPPHRAIREPVVIAAVARKEWLLDNDGFKAMIRGGGDFVVWFLLGYIPWVEMSGVGSWKAGD